MTAFEQKKKKKKNKQKTKKTKMQRKLKMFQKKCKETDLKRTAVDCGLNLTTGYAQ